MNPTDQVWQVLNDLTDVLPQSDGSLLIGSIAISEAADRITAIVVESIGDVIKPYRTENSPLLGSNPLYEAGFNAAVDIMQAKWQTKGGGESKTLCSCFTRDGWFNCHYPKEHGGGEC